MTTLLAIYRRPPGGPEAEAAFEAAYRDRHLPQVAATPGLRSLRVRRVRRQLAGDEDFILAATMEFDDWAALRAGLGSEPMQRAGEVLAEIAPGLVALVALEEAPDLEPPTPA